MENQENIKYPETEYKIMITIDGTIMTEKTHHDEFWHKFIQFVEENNWAFIGMTDEEEIEKD